MIENLILMLRGFRAHKSFMKPGGGETKPMPAWIGWDKDRPYCLVCGNYGVEEYMLGRYILDFGAVKKGSECMTSGSHD